MGEEQLGAITLKEVIEFQTRLMMGAQFGRIKKTDAKPQDLLIACLRMGWNDAFRHTSENVRTQSESERLGKKQPDVLECAEKEWRKKHKEEHDDFICAILAEDVVLDAFRNFVRAENSQTKILCICEKNGELKKELKNLFGQYKRTDGTHPLCFGHFQKMFNIALKLYVCLYVCRKQLDLAAEKFEDEILENVANADCPVDSIVLKRLSEDTKNPKFAEQKWSHYGTEGNPNEEYQKVQQAISEQLNDSKKSRLYYDFTVWNRA